MTRIVGGVTYTYTYGRPHGATQVNGSTLQYDNNGNVTFYTGVGALTYDYDNMMTAMGSTTYVYDYAGQRVKRGSTVYIGNLYEKTGTTVTRHIFAGSQRIAQHSGSTVYYYHGDHIGSTGVVTGSAGTSVKSFFYYPYGQTYYSTGSATIKYKFTSEEEDTGGIYHLGARYYDPKIGRFLTADTIVPDYSDPQTLNRYSYCRNNPVIYTDPSGNIFLIDDILIGAAIGAAIGGATSAVTGGDILQGMAMGAITGAFLGPASGNFFATVAAGAVAGGTNAAIFGGNIGEGMLYGAVGAAAGYGLGSALQGQGLGNETFQFGAQVAGGGLISGGIAELSGGKFSEGFASGAVGAAMGYGIGKLMPKGDQTPAEQGEMIQADLTVNHSDAPTSAEWQQAEWQQVAMGSTDPNVGDVPTGYLPARKAIPGELGTAIFLGTADVARKIGSAALNDVRSPLIRSLRYRTLIPIIVPNRLPVPEGQYKGTTIR